jgi:hypothetical protein
MLTEVIQDPDVLDAVDAQHAEMTGKINKASNGCQLLKALDGFALTRRLWDALGFADRSADALGDFRGRADAMIAEEIAYAAAHRLSATAAVVSERNLQNCRELLNRLS